MAGLLRLVSCSCASSNVAVDGTKKNDQVIRALSSSTIHSNAPKAMKLGEMDYNETRHISPRTAYGKFWDFHRRLSSNAHHVKSETTVDIDVEEKASDDEESFDGADASSYVSRASSLATLSLDVIQSESDNSGLESQWSSSRQPELATYAIHQFNVAVDRFTARFRSCTLAHLVMASFINVPDIKLARRLLSKDYLSLSCVETTLASFARILDLEGAYPSAISRWSASIPIKELTSRQCEECLELMWHNHALLRCVDARLLRKSFHAAIRKAARIRIEYTGRHKMIRRSITRTPAMNDALRTLIDTT